MSIGSNRVVDIAFTAKDVLHFLPTLKLLPNRKMVRIEEIHSTLSVVEKDAVMDILILFRIVNLYHIFEHNVLIDGNAVFVIRRHHIESIKSRNVQHCLVLTLCGFGYFVIFCIFNFLVAFGLLIAEPVGSYFDGSFAMILLIQWGATRSWFLFYSAFG